MTGSGGADRAPAAMLKRSLESSADRCASQYQLQRSDRDIASQLEASGLTAARADAARRVSVKFSRKKKKKKIQNPNRFSAEALKQVKEQGQKTHKLFKNY